PCNFYPDKEAEVRASRRWLCACDEMKQYKYCHCLLFVTPEGLPVTEYLPEGHEGRQVYGLVRDPTPGKGREGLKKGEEVVSGPRLARGHTGQERCHGHRLDPVAAAGPYPGPGNGDGPGVHRAPGHRRVGAAFPRSTRPPV